MKFYSTNKKSPHVDLEAAVMNGLAPDGGLYMPEVILKLRDNFFNRAGSLSFKDIAFEVGKKFFLPVIPKNILGTIVGGLKLLTQRVY